MRTADGSFTYESPLFKETFHSKHGALSESQHVFVQAGLETLLSKFVGQTLYLFEMGLGSGLNALLTALYAFRHSREVIYHSLEAYPLPLEDLDGFEIQNQIDSQAAAELFKNIHHGPWEDLFPLTRKFSLLKLREDFISWKAPEEKYHGIYYDAFAPRAQPELWTRDVAEKLFSMLLPGGLVVTYCAQGQFKRNLKAAGFIVEPLPGPVGKREMTRAWK